MEEYPTLCWLRQQQDVGFVSQRNCYADGMSALPFDTLKLAERLESGGFTPEQARTAASALAEAASGAELVTKQDLLATEQRLTIRLGGMLVVLAGVLSAVFHYLR
jgi:hypothetical protein